MRTTVDPRRFTGLPLVTKAIAEDDYIVLIDGIRAGRIMRQARSFGNTVWLWTVTGPALVQAGLTSSGEADTLDEAKLAFREAFDRWLDWALAADVAVHWMEG
jgi:hypothetical protein